MPTNAISNNRSHALSPYLIVDDAAAAINYYKKAFNAIEGECVTLNDGKIMHAELEINGSTIMLGDKFPTALRNTDPKKLGGSPVILYMSVPNVDEVFAQAISAGASIIKPVEDSLYGTRMGELQDPFGHYWNISLSDQGYEDALEFDDQEISE
jgi:PhnB protein